MKIAAWITGAVLTVVSACGPLAEKTAIVGVTNSLFGFGGESEEAAVSLSTGLTRERIESWSVDLLRVSIISFEATDVFVKTASNSGRTSWATPEGFGLVFEDGLLIGSRGFGDDLMGADIAGASASLRRGGNHTRILDFLTGLGQIERVSFQCSTAHIRQDRLEIYERSYDTTIIEENCTGENLSFKNTYWRDSSGVIWQSRQWISPKIGYLGYQRL